MCNNNFDVPLKIEMWKFKENGSHWFLGQAFFTLNDLVGRKKSFEFENLNKKEIGS